ncbi:MAG: helix-turn-helix domain-containing protein [Candidatus Thiodiazotropha sp.]
MHAHKLHLLASEPPCSGCQAEPFCLQSAFSGEQLSDFKKAIRIRGPFERGEAIYREGLPFNAIYFIQKGSVKTEVCTASGMLEVTAFYLIGELLGVDAIGSDHYPSDAVAMEETINSDVYQWALARNLKAKQKVAWFIFNLFKRVRSRQSSNLRAIPLPMRKTDIANYLGLAPESLSRALHALEEEGMIVNQPKQIYLSDIQKAQSMSLI